MENLESHGILVKVMDFKAICLQKIKGQKYEKFEKKQQTSQKQALISVEIKTSTNYAL